MFSRLTDKGVYSDFAFFSIYSLGRGDRKIQMGNSDSKQEDDRDVYAAAKKAAKKQVKDCTAALKNAKAELESFRHDFLHLGEMIDGLKGKDIPKAEAEHAKAVKMQKRAVREQKELCNDQNALSNAVKVAVRKEVSHFTLGAERKLKALECLQARLADLQKASNTVAEKVQQKENAVVKCKQDLATAKMERAKVKAHRDILHLSASLNEEGYPPQKYEPAAAAAAAADASPPQKSTTLYPSAPPPPTSQRRRTMAEVFRTHNCVRIRTHFNHFALSVPLEQHRIEMLMCLNDMISELGPTEARRILSGLGLSLWGHLPMPKFYDIPLDAISTEGKIRELLLSKEPPSSFVRG